MIAPGPAFVFWGEGGLLGCENLIQHIANFTFNEAGGCATAAGVKHGNVAQQLADELPISRPNDDWCYRL